MIFIENSILQSITIICKLIQKYKRYKMKQLYNSDIIMVYNNIIMVYNNKYSY